MTKTPKKQYKIISSFFFRSVISIDDPRIRIMVPDSSFSVIRNQDLPEIHLHLLAYRIQEQSLNCIENSD
jgi:hypothetical protein